MDRRPLIARNIVNALVEDCVNKGGRHPAESVDREFRKRWEQICIDNMVNKGVFPRGNGCCDIEDPRMIEQFLDKYPWLALYFDDAVRFLRSVSDAPLRATLWVDPEYFSVLGESQHITLRLMDEDEGDLDSELHTRVSEWQYDMYGHNADAADLLRVEVVSYFSPPETRLAAALRWSGFENAGSLVNHCTHRGEGDFPQWSFQKEGGGVDHERREALVTDLTALFEGEREATDDEFTQLARLFEIKERWLRNPEPPPPTAFEAGESIWTWIK